MNNAPQTDPLDLYNREDLLALIESQALENNDLRQRADQFEHLYRDVMTSTAWKLSWPIRAAFKVLTTIKKRLQRSREVVVAAIQSGAGSPEAQRNFEHRLADLAVFKAPSPINRVTWVVTERLNDLELQQTLLKLVNLAGSDNTLRLLSLDPELTARQVMANVAQSQKFVFHALEKTASLKNIFRLDFHPNEQVVVQSDAVRAFFCKFVDAQQIEVIKGGKANEKLKDS